MVNSEAFASRLQMVMDHYHLNGSSFAESIGVQRSAISHILSGRNKPSLEFVMKILDAYPDIELYWLLNGKGNSPFRETQPGAGGNLFNAPEASESNKEPQPEQKEETALPLPEAVNTQKKQVTRVLIFYDDNTFEEINNAL